MTYGYERWFSFYFSLKSFECKSTSKLEIVLKFNEMNEFEENVWSFVFQFVSNWVCLMDCRFWEENCDGFIIGRKSVLFNRKYMLSYWNSFALDLTQECCCGLGGRKPVLNLLRENTCSVYSNAFDSRSDARTWISVLCIRISTTSQLMIVQFSTTPASRTCRARFI